MQGKVSEQQVANTSEVRELNTNQKVDVAKVRADIDKEASVTVQGLGNAGSAIEAFINKVKEKTTLFMVNVLNLLGAKKQAGEHPRPLVARGRIGWHGPYRVARASCP